MKNIDINQVAHLYYTRKRVYMKSQRSSDTAHRCPFTPALKENGLQRRSYAEAHTIRYSQKHLNIDLAEIVRLYLKSNCPL